ncbi:retrovirus-related pol polyprotein from transposon TNT 1-94 [Tanacetum coccineum]
MSINCSLQNKVIRVNLENESLKDEISDLKKALGGRGKRKDKISSKEVIFTKADESSSLSIPEIISDSESKCETQEPLPPLPKLKGVAPAGTSYSLISQSVLTLNMADLTLDTSVPKKTRPTSVKVPPTYVIKRKTENKLPAVPKSCSNKKADSFTKQLLLTLMEQCSTCGSTDHLTKEHLEYAAVKKKLIKLKAQSPLNLAPKKAPMIPKPFKDCKYCGFNDHHSDNYEYYPGCKVCGSVAHEPTDCHKKHPNSKRPRIANKQSTKPTKKVAYVNGQKHNLISSSHMCDANFKVLFTKTQGTIFNQNDEVVLIALRRRDVYVIDMSSFNKESNACFFAKASPSVNWMWHKRLSHLNFKNINNLAKYNLVSGLPSLTFSKDKNCSACEKGKHHRVSFKTKRYFSINKSLLLLHMDLFGLVKRQTISHNKYTIVIVDEYSRRMENLNEVRVKELRSDNGTKFKNHKLEDFCDKKEEDPLISATVHIHNHRDHLGKFNEKADDGFFLGYSPMAKAFRVIEGDGINFNENRSSPDDKFLEPRSKATQCFGNIEYFPYILAYENITPVDSLIPQDSVSHTDPPEFTEADNHPTLNELDQHESVDIPKFAKIQDNVIIEPISDIQSSPTTISPSAKVILQIPVPQDR